MASSLDSHLGYWLRLVSNHVTFRFTRKVEAQGVTVAEWVVLRQLLGQQEITPSQLADQLGMTRGAVSKLIERLCQKNLVERQSLTEDRRYQHLGLTSAGQALVPVLARLADENEAECFGHLSAGQQQALRTALQELARQHGWKETPVS